MPKAVGASNNAFWIIKINYVDGVYIGACEAISRSSQASSTIYIARRANIADINCVLTIRTNSNTLSCAIWEIVVCCISRLTRVALELKWSKAGRASWIAINTGIISFLSVVAIWTVYQTFIVVIEI